MIQILVCDVDWFVLHASIATEKGTDGDKKPADYTKFEYQIDWGENYTGKMQPCLVLFEIKERHARVLSTPNYAPAQVSILFVV